MCLFTVNTCVNFLLFIQIWNHVVVTLLKQMIQEYLSRSVSCKIWWTKSTIFGASSWSGRRSRSCPVVEDKLAVFVLSN